MAKSDITVDFNTVKINARFTVAGTMAQKWIDSEVLKDSAPFVPRLSGALEHSGIDGTVIGSGEVVYNSPYAHAQYYGDFNHSIQSHPQACRAWFEAAKAQNKSKWLAGVRKLGGGG